MSKEVYAVKNNERNQYLVYNKDGSYSFYLDSEGEDSMFTTQDKDLAEELALALDSEVVNVTNKVNKKKEEIQDYATKLNKQIINEVEEDKRKESEFKLTNLSKSKVNLASKYYVGKLTTVDGVKYTVKRLGYSTITEEDIKVSYHLEFGQDTLDKTKSIILEIKESELLTGSDDELVLIIGDKLLKEIIKHREEIEDNLLNISEEAKTKINKNFE